MYLQVIKEDEPKKWPILNSEHQIIWYGIDSKGNTLSRGVYIALLKDSQGNKRTIKFVIQR